MIQTIISDGKAEFDYLQALKARQQETNADVTRAVQDILDDVRREGDAAVTRYSAKFDHAEGPIRVIEAAEIADAKSRIDAELLGDILSQLRMNPSRNENKILIGLPFKDCAHHVSQRVVSLMQSSA